MKKWVLKRFVDVLKLKGLFHTVFTRFYGWVFFRRFFFCFSYFPAVLLQYMLQNSQSCFSRMTGPPLAVWSPSMMLEVIIFDFFSFTLLLAGRKLQRWQIMWQIVQLTFIVTVVVLENRRFYVYHILAPK